VGNEGLIVSSFLAKCLTKYEDVDKNFNLERFYSQEKIFPFPQTP